MRSDLDRLKDILKAIEDIEQFTTVGKQAFEQDKFDANWGFIPNYDYR
ncbi:MAG: nucleotidyltransferase [Hormoscilla sp. GM102CHS1]|nr:nucleotidyltransferase [Hormoscilla sp. GM102CHS1]